MCMKSVASRSTNFLSENVSASGTWHPLYTSIIRASVEKGSPCKALRDFGLLRASASLRPSRGAFQCVLQACRSTLNLRIACQTHATIVKSGLGWGVHLSSHLVSVYIACNRLHDARQLFDEIPELGSEIFSVNLLIMGYLRVGDYDSSRRFFARMRNKDLTSWNSMITGSVKNGRSKEALNLFNRMLSAGFESDGFTFAALLSACARLGALNCGEWVHNLMFEKAVDLNYILTAALIDMYSKCGRIETAAAIFESAKRDDISIWNSMITGLAIHGLGREVEQVFSRMERENMKPDTITFVGTLTACSRCGMLEEGRMFFAKMKEDYKIEPRLEHYGAMVDLLARAGLLQETYEMIKQMPLEPDVAMWRALLSACRTYREPRMGEAVMEEMSQLSSGDYVLLSNMYASDNRWRCAERVREDMRAKRIRKGRGVSQVEIGRVIHEFKAGDRSHRETAAIYGVLDGLMRRAKEEGFTSATELALLDVLEEEKEWNLNCHCEKLAVAFAVLKTGPRAEIRVLKNLRTCWDCHSWIKVVSRSLRRVIIMRDRVRFHRFEDGSCSCGDYW